ncbi:MAG TPA: response regulator [Polyangiaceae bacterium]|nr:response regulator [Polyangiaceae bacterium]
MDPYRYFRVEADEILGQLQQGLLELEKGASSAETVASLLRLAHTLKGAARVVKQTRIADLSHALEDIFVPIRNAGSAVEPSAISKSLGYVDAMRAQLLLLSAPVTKTETTKVAAAPDRAPDEPFWAAKPNVEDLDVLMDGIGELNSQLGGIRRARRIFERARGVSDLLVEQFAPRRTGQAGDSGTAKLRALAEELQATLGIAEREIIASVDLAGRELVQVRDAAERLRLVPAELMWGALERTARDAAVSLGKQVKFTAQGGDIRLDAEVLGLIQRALMQAVRNAVAHGVESPTERQAAGKLAEGQVVILVQRRDKDVVFSCRDDGRGLDLEAVRRGAERQGVAPATAATMGAEALIQLLMRGGISTAHAVTGMSGRGIGLDLVRETAEKLGGRVHLESAAGRGTTVAIAVPASMSALSALLVEVAGQVVALPLSAVRGTSRQNAADVAHTPDGDTVLMEGQVVPYVQLARLLGAREAERAASASRSAVLMSAQAGLLALEVDRLLGVESIVVRALPELASLDSVVSGASLDADGNPRMVLGPEGLVKAARKLVAAPKQASSPHAPILVIDDSLTTRMLEQSILESAGYEVDLATSGEEGLEKARQRKYALFLVDVEMPGIDGFTFIAEIRNDPALKDIPAILVTSRASDQDRQRGVAVGAQAHIEKREFDQADLLQRIRKLVSWA